MNPFLIRDAPWSTFAGILRSPCVATVKGMCSMLLHPVHTVTQLPLYSKMMMESILKHASTAAERRNTKTKTNLRVYPISQIYFTSNLLSNRINPVCADTLSYRGPAQ